MKAEIKSSGNREMRGYGRSPYVNILTRCLRPARFWQWLTQQFVNIGLGNAAESGTGTEVPHES